MWAGRLAIALVVTLALSACQGADEHRQDSSKVEDVLLKPGDCFADEVLEEPFGPELTSKVPCSKKHLYEVVGVSEVPDRFLSGQSRRALLHTYTKLLDLKSQDNLNDEDTLDSLTPFEGFMAKVCSRTSLAFAGLGDLVIGGRSGVDLLAQPMVSSANTEWFLPSEAHWLNERGVAYCAFRFDESDSFDYAEADRVAAPSNQALAREVIDPSAPHESRFCVNYVKDRGYRPERTSCVKIHDAEAFLSYEVDAMTGSSRLGNRVYEVQDLTDKQYDILTEPCLDSMASVLGPHDPDLYVDVLWEDSPEWDVKGQRRVECVVTSEEGTRLPGRSLIGDARNVKLVERGDDT